MPQMIKPVGVYYSDILYMMPCYATWKLCMLESPVDVVSGGKNLERNALLVMREGGEQLCMCSQLDLLMVN